MCGICGYFSFTDAPFPQDLIGRMCKTLAHRGPDGQKEHRDGPIALGQRRLAVIDLRPLATAPLSNEDGTVWVVFNGEIYNYRRLRDELSRGGHQFATETDTEVIVHLYEDLGAGFVNKLHGMFAIALWDSRRRILFAARDRLGKKPFYYVKTPNGFAFASEIKAILEAPGISREPNWPSIDQYLANHYILSPNTAFKGIWSLQPGHTLKCDESGHLSVAPYWEPPVSPASQLPEEELQWELQRRLREAVRARLVSDVPVGAFLSGGIDSATVVALMSRESSRPIKTFTIGFEDLSHDERPWARLVAERCGTDHYEEVLKPDVIDIVEELSWHYDEPFADSSAIPTFCVSKAARREVTVALTGDGGDELFGGYSRYGEQISFDYLQRIAKPVRRICASAAPVFRGSSRHQLQKFGRGLFLLNADLPQRYELQMSCFKPEERDRAYTDHRRAVLSAAARLEGIGALAWHKSICSLAWMMRNDQRWYLSDCLMTKTDRAAMAHSLEVRCPLMDHDLVAFAASLPARLKRRGSKGKLILRQAAQEFLPPELFDRPKKGFAVPLARWLRNDLRGFLSGTLLHPRATQRDIIKPEYTRQMIDQHLTGERDWSNRLWALLMLELWFQRFID